VFLPAFLKFDAKIYALGSRVQEQVQDQVQKGFKKSKANSKLKSKMAFSSTSTRARSSLPS
jgi:hypothetical protein